MSSMLLGHCLTLVGVPEVLLDEVSWGRARPPGDGVRYPVGGWDRVPGMGDVRLWADIDLVHWFDTAASHGLVVFGPEQQRVEIAELEAAARIARASGEGVRTLWGLDVQTDDGFVWVNDLVVYGPALSDPVVAEVSAAVYRGCDGHALLAGPNCRYPGVYYVSTMWAAGVVA